MKLLVYGVTNWDNFEEAEKIKPDLIEWYERVIKFLPTASKVFIASGTYSPPSFNPLPCDLYQVENYKIGKYSRNNLYFRVGFLTGIWKALLDFSDFDVLLHVQCRNFVGQDLTSVVEEFWKRPEDVMSLNWKSSANLRGIEISFFGMKKRAAQLYTMTGLRQSCDPDPFILNSEDEAYELFKDTWYNPWPEIDTIRQHDRAFKYLKKAKRFIKREPRYNIQNIEDYTKYPVVCAGKHVDPFFLKAWQEANPYT